MPLNGVICDIEGTTSAISFVHKVLFPLSRERLPAYLKNHGRDADVVEQLGALWHKTQNRENPPAELSQALLPVLQGYIENDIKDTTLKWIQGRIWKEAFESGAIAGHIYADVAETWREWVGRGLRIYIYSSGSTEAQKLMFRYSQAGDLSSLLSGYFDTNVGGKREAASYGKIASSLGIPAADLLFLSDVAEELAAASEQGMKTCLLLREGIWAPRDYKGAIAEDFHSVDRQFFTN